MKNLGLKLLLLCVMGIFTLGASATPDKDYLCFTANADGSTVGMTKYGTPYDVSLEYSTDDGKNWTSISWTEGSYGSIISQTILLNSIGDKVYFRNAKAADEVSGFSKSGNDYYTFEMDGSIAVSGNVMSLVDSEVKTKIIPCDYCFYGLFEGCHALTSAPVLPATTLKSHCYANLFFCCSHLTSAPALPAKTLTERCYDSMFVDCVSLTDAPTLPADALATFCYYYMFNGCTGLTDAPLLPATDLAEGCYCQMFSKCTGLRESRDLPATNLAKYCCAYMFEGCTSLTNAPALPATNLADFCYIFMFEGCTSLTNAPELPAPAIRNGCYVRMFKGCTSLKSIKVGFTKWYQGSGTDEDMDATALWVDGIETEGMFICPDELVTESGENRIPSGWTQVFEVKANKDPKYENYYSTFYSSKNAYKVPSGVTAYTGVVEEDASNSETSVLKLTAIADGIIPADEPVILRAKQSQVYLPYTTTTATKSTDNKLIGTDVAIDALGANDYALSLGQNGVGFYQWKDKSIDAHKAYLTLTASAGAKAFTFELKDEPTGIESLTPTLSEGEGAIYNLNGVRVDGNYKGVVIKNGKKVYRK